MTLREQFPILQREVNGHRLVYLDNAATPETTGRVDAMNAYYSESNANVTGPFTPSPGKRRKATILPHKLKERFNADKVIITSGTTEAINLVAHAWGQPTSTKATPSFSRKWNITPTSSVADAGRRGGIELRYVPVMPDFTSTWRRSLTPFRGETGLCVHTSNVLGVRNPRGHHRRLSRCGRQGAHRCGARRPHSTVDFEAFGADFMAFSAHKMCGPTGIGALLVQPDAFEEMQPFMGGVT